MNLSEASKKEIDVVLEKCGWRQTKQRVVLLKSIFDGKDKHFSINQMNETLKDNRSYFSLTTLYENLNTLVDKGYLKQIVVDKQSFYDTNTTSSCILKLVVWVKNCIIFFKNINQIFRYKVIRLKTCTFFF